MMKCQSLSPRNLRPLLFLLAASTIACATARTPSRPARSIEENKRLVRRYYEEVASTGDVDRIQLFISPDYVEVHENTRHPIGLEGAREHVRGVRRVYPDLVLTVEQQIAEGQWVVSRLTMRGTHAGVWMGIEPTGKRVEVTAVNIDRVVDGRIVEHGGAANLLEPLLGIGAVQVVGRQNGSNLRRH